MPEGINHKSAREFLEVYPELDRYGDGSLTVKIWTGRKSAPLPDGVDWVMNIENSEKTDDNVNWKSVSTTQLPPIVFDSELAAIKSLKVSVSSTVSDDERLLHAIYGKIRK